MAAGSRERWKLVQGCDDPQSPFTEHRQSSGTIPCVPRELPVLPKVSLQVGQRSFQVCCAPSRIFSPSGGGVSGADRGQRPVLLVLTDFRVWKPWKPKMKTMDLLSKEKHLSTLGGRKYHSSGTSEVATVSWCLCWGWGWP